MKPEEVEGSITASRRGRGSFPDERPRNFRRGSVVIRHHEVAAQFHVNRNGDRDRFLRYAICLPDSGMLFQKAEPIFEFHIEGVFPTEVSSVANPRKNSLAVWAFERVEYFHILSSNFNCCTVCINLRAGIQPSIPTILTGSRRPINLPFESKTWTCRGSWSPMNHSMM